MDVVFGQALKMIEPLVSARNMLVDSVNPNVIPEKIRPFFGCGGITWKINPRDYLIRIGRYCKCSPACYVVAMIYLHRLIEKVSPESSNYIPLYNNITFYRIFLTAVVLAIKFVEDCPMKVGYYAEVGGISKCDLIGIEACFLRLIDFDFYVSPEEFEYYLGELVERKKQLVPA